MDPRPNFEQFSDIKLVFSKRELNSQLRDLGRKFAFKLQNWKQFFNTGPENSIFCFPGNRNASFQWTRIFCANRIFDDESKLWKQQKMLKVKHSVQHSVKICQTLLFDSGGRNSSWVAFVPFTLQPWVWDLAHFNVKILVQCSERKETWTAANRTPRLPAEEACWKI